MTVTLSNRSGIRLSAILATLSLIFLAASAVQAQSSGDWNGKSAAVVLTYDDAEAVHLDTVIPVLDENGLKGSFYVTVDFDGFKNRVDDWALITENGHELANHTLFHPCGGPVRESGFDDYNLSTYSVDRIIDELVVTNQVLDLMDGRPMGRTFAYPCGNMTAGGESYKEALEPHFTAARSTQQRVESIEDIDLYNIGTYVIRDHSAEAMINMAENAVAEGGLITYLFHGVGGPHSYNVDPEAHRELVEWLKANEDDIWITTLSEVADYVRVSR